MDPNANITEQRELANKIAESTSTHGEPIAAARLSELVLALDEWRLKGGFDPYNKDLTCPNCGTVGSILDGSFTGISNNPLTVRHETCGQHYPWEEC